MSSAPESIDPRAGLWSWLAFELRFQRTLRSLSLAETAAILTVSRKAVQNWEAGRNTPESKHLMRLDQAWNTGGLLERIRWYATTGHDPDWFAEYSRYERLATVIKIFQANTIPGLLQIESYARELFMAGGSSDVEKDVKTRMGRQEVLSRPTPPHLGITLDARVFDVQDDPEVWKEQVRHLIDLGDLPNVTMRIVPRGGRWYPGLDGSFHIMRSNGTDMAFVEAPGGGRLVQGSEVEEFHVRWERIGTRALPWDASKHLMIGLLEGTS